MPRWRARARARARRGPRRAARDRDRGPSPTRRARRRAGWRTASSRTRSAPAARRTGSWRSSTTNSLARTGTLTAARTARRSSSEPPNQCGSHRTEIAAAPPAWYARARATMSSPAAAIAPADGEDRLISAMRWRPGRARRPTIVARRGRVRGSAREVAIRGRAELGRDVRRAPRGDLVDDGRLRRARPRRRGRSHDGHAGAPSARRRRASRSCAVRSARSGASRRAGRAGVDRRAGQRDPVAPGSPSGPATVSAGRGIEEDDVAPRAAARRAGRASTIRAFSSGVPPASSRRRRAGASPSATGSTGISRTPAGSTSWMTPVPSSGSSSTPAPWTTNARSVPSRWSDLGDPRRERRIGRPRGRAA